jgi:hypothetical protein
LLSSSLSDPDAAAVAVAAATGSSTFLAAGLGSSTLASSSVAADAPYMNLFASFFFFLFCSLYSSKTLGRGVSNGFLACCLPPLAVVWKSIYHNEFRG